MNPMTARDVIDLLHLEPLPREGGWYRETWRSPVLRDFRGYPAPRAVGTAIYYLLCEGEASVPHALPGVEVWHFYAGDPVELTVTPPGGTPSVTILGADLAAGQRPQAVIPAGATQAGVLVPGGRWALLGTTMAPGFDPADWMPR